MKYKCGILSSAVSWYWTYFESWRDLQEDYTISHLRELQITSLQIECDQRHDEYSISLRQEQKLIQSWQINKICPISRTLILRVRVEDRRLISFTIKRMTKNKKYAKQWNYLIFILESCEYLRSRPCDNNPKKDHNHRFFEDHFDIDFTWKKKTISVLLTKSIHEN